MENKKKMIFNVLFLFLVSMEHSMECSMERI